MSGVLESVLYRTLRFNPCVAMHELRMRMRGVRPFLVMLAYTLVAVAVSLGTLAVITLDQGIMYGPGAVDNQLGRIIFTALAYTQLSLILVVLPGYAAGAITMEREKRTFDMLKATLLSPADVVTGKLLVVLAFGAILVVTCVPIAAWCLMLGGLGPLEVFYVYTFLLAVAAVVTGLGLCMSALLRRSIGAIVATYVIIIFFHAGVPIVVVAVLSALFRMISSPPVLGFAGATLLALAVIALAAWLAYPVIRSFWRRILRNARAWVITLISSALTALLVAIGAGAAVLTLPVSSQLPLETLATLHSYFAMAGILYSESFQIFTRAAGGGAATWWSTIDPQFGIWLIVVSVYLFMALVLWAGTVRILRARM